VPSAQPEGYDEEVIGYVQSFRYLGMIYIRPGSSHFRPNIWSDGLKAAFALRRRCVELGIRDLEVQIV